MSIVCMLAATSGVGAVTAEPGPRFGGPRTATQQLLQLPAGLALPRQFARQGVLGSHAGNALITVETNRLMRGACHNCQLLKAVSCSLVKSTLQQPALPIASRLCAATTGVSLVCCAGAGLAGGAVDTGHASC
jgi:hypothetical protein